MTKQVQTQTTSSGIGISTVLVIVFLILKLVGVIDWSWWWNYWWIIFNYSIDCRDSIYASS